MHDTDGREALQHAKQPQSIFAGPYGHPLHPAVVALPIGAWSTSLLFDILSHRGAPGSSYARASRDTMLVGLGGAALAAVLGLLDWSRLKPGTKAAKLGTTHMLINLGTTAFYGAAAARRSRYAGADDTRVRRLDIVANAAALGGLSVSGFLGGELAYRYGVRVADEATQRKGHEIA